MVWLDWVLITVFVVVVVVVSTLRYLTTILVPVWRLNSCACNWNDLPVGRKAVGGKFSEKVKSPPRSLPSLIQ